MRSVFLKTSLILLAGISFLTATGQGMKRLGIDVLERNESSYVEHYRLNYKLLTFFNAINPPVEKIQTGNEIDAAASKTIYIGLNTPFGVIIIATGIIVVVVLIAVFVIFINKLKARNSKKTAQMDNAQKETVPVEVAQDAKNLDIVAISMALHLYFDNQHEVEQTGFWLNRPLNAQTAWAAKSNLLKKSPIRKY